MGKVRAKILVVDDDLSFLELVSDLLTADGYEVNTAANGMDALDKIRGEKYNLLLTGIMMPGMTGFELYESVRKIAPYLANKTIVISSSIDSADTKEFLTKYNLPYFSKPFIPKQLVRVVNEVLNSGKRNWFERKHQEVITPEAVVLALLKETTYVVKENSKILKEQLDTDNHSKLPKVEEELFYFFVFALDYWFQISPNHSQEERRIFRQAFVGHLENIVAPDTLQERFATYGQTVNENKEYKFKFLGLATKLSEFCGISHIYTMVLAPSLFKLALEHIGFLKSVHFE